MKYIVIIWMLLLAGACKKSPYQDQTVSNQLVILAEITAGDSLRVPVSKTIQVGSGGIINFEKVNSASVKIGRQDGRSWTLRLNTSIDYLGNPASIYTAPQKPHSNMTYFLQVQDPLSGTVTAEATVPPPVHVRSVDTVTEVHNGIPMLRLSFTLIDSPGVAHYFVFEAMKEILTPDSTTTNNFIRLAVHTDDANVDNAQLSSLDSPFRRIFLPGSIFSSFYKTSFLVERKYFVTNDHDSRGRVLLQIRSVSLDLYKYLFWYEKYRSDVGAIPLGQLYSPPGNIQNGLGIFGASSKRQWMYYFEPLH